MAPLDYMGRYMKDFFDYAIVDELHQLAGDTAQGNGLAVLERIGKKLIGLTGTMMGGYADDLYIASSQVSRASPAIRRCRSLSVLAITRLSLRSRPSPCKRRPA